MKHRVTNPSMIGMLAYALAAQIPPASTAPYLPEGKKKPTFTEKRKAAEAKRLAKRRGR